MQRFRIICGALSQRLGDEIVIVHPNTDRIFLLNRTGARVWELLSESMNLDDIRKIMSQEFEGDGEQFSEDIDAFVSSLLNESLLEVSHDFE